MKYFLAIFIFLLFQNILFSKEQILKYTTVADNINKAVAYLVTAAFGIYSSLILVDRRFKKLEIQINNE